MKTTFRSESDAIRVSRRGLLSVGWHDAPIIEAIEKASKRGTDMIELTITIADAEGNQRTLRDWLTDTALGAAKLRHACEAVGALTRYESGAIGQADFPGHDVRVKIGIEKKRGYPDRNVIEDYAAASAAVDLRAAE